MPADPSGMSRFYHLDHPIVQALIELGGSAQFDVLLEKVVEREGFTDAELALRRGPDQDVGVLEYGLALSLKYLKRDGLVENSVDDVWTITPLGRETIWVGGQSPG